jgi:signal transduction histidine kinase/streptogramin lyase
MRFTRSGVLWLGTNRGLYRMERETFVAAIAEVPITRVEEGVDGHLLVITTHGFMELDGDRRVDHPDLAARLGVPQDKIYHVIEDHLGGRWFCTTAGVAHQTGKSIEKLQPFGIPGVEAFRAMEDSQGNVWVTLSTGLFRVRNSTLESMSVANPRAIMADRDGDLWVGTNGGGLVRFKNRVVRMFGAADGLPNDVTIATLTGSDGRLWVGNNCGGLSWFDGRRFQVYSEKDGLTNSCVRALAEDGNHDLWIATSGGGAFRFHDGRFTNFTMEQGLPSNNVYNISAMRDGSLWFRTSQGIAQMHNGTIRTLTIKDGLSSNTVNDIRDDEEGGVWVTTTAGVDHVVGDRAPVSSLRNVPNLSGIIEISGRKYARSITEGLFRIEGDRLVSISSVPHLSGVMLEEPSIWLCADGIVRAPPDSFQRWEQEPNQPRDYTIFGREDGLTSLGCSYGNPGAAFTKDGKVWIGTGQGLAMIDTARLPASNAKPSIYMEEITVGRTLRPPARELVLAPGTNHVELRFDAIELRSPEKIRFQYRLDGVDNEWSEASPDGSAIYNSFPLGRNQFHVRASNRDGIWDHAGIVYPITQQPFFYQTQLFRLAVAGTILLAMAGAYQFRLRQMAAQMNAQLNARVEERTRLARELHDTLLQTIHASSMIVHVVQEVPGNPPPTAAGLAKLAGWLTRATQEARSSLESLRGSAVLTNELGESFRDAGMECVQDRPIQFNFSTTGTAREVHAIIRDEVHRIGCEAIRNAFSHSQGDIVALELIYGKDLVVRIRDNGKGIDSEIAGKGRVGHFGLQGMRERAARIGAKLYMTTSPGNGTLIELIVPGRLVFRTRWPMWRNVLRKRTLPPE